MVPDADVIHVMGQTGDEFEAFGHRRNLNQRNRSAKDQIAQKGDVNFQRGNFRVGFGLAARQKMADFQEQIISDTDNHLAVHSEFHHCRFTGSFIFQRGISGMAKCKTASVNRNLFAFV